MMRLLHSRWSPFPLLLLLAVPLLPAAAGGQSQELRGTQEEALRRMEERLAELQEQIRRMQVEMEAGRALALGEMEADQVVRIREIQERARRLGEERGSLARIQGEEARERVREMAVRIREGSAEDRARLERRLDDVHQVVVRVRARARLGVSLNGSQGEEYDARGALIVDVTEDSPAQRAGLRPDDIITHVDGAFLLDPIPEESEKAFPEGTSLPVQRLMALARDLEDGQEVEVRYLREGNARTVTLEAAELGNRWVTVAPGEFEVEMPRLELEDFRFDTLRGWNMIEGEGPNLRFFREGDRRGLAYFNPGNNVLFGLGGNHFHGVEFRALNPDLASYFSTDRGVLVLEVDDESTLGLLPGDVVLSVGDRAVENTPDILRILGSYERDEAVTFTVMRQGRETRVEGTIG